MISEFSWLRIQSKWWVLVNSVTNFWILKNAGISWLADELSAFLEWPRSTEALAPYKKDKVKKGKVKKRESDPVTGPVWPRGGGGGRGKALRFHARGTRRGWVVSSMPRPHFTPGKDPVPILQEAGWAQGPVWTGGKSRPHRDSIPDRPARS